MSRIDSIRQQLNDLVEGAKNDSKSTAGDKHETARAMMQIEQEKLSNQLGLVLAQLNTLEAIVETAVHETICAGSLIKTNHGLIYISIPLGKIEVSGKSVVCISPRSPLGQMLIGKRTGEKVVVNDVEYRIDELS